MERPQNPVEYIGMFINLGKVAIANLIMEVDDALYDWSDDV